MLEPEPPLVLDLTAWVGKARRNPALYRQRQVMHVILQAVAMVPELEEALYLKGGALMAIAYGSPRVTADLDFSTLGDPLDIEGRVATSLDKVLPIAARRAGYFEVLCKVQRVIRRPRPTTFLSSPFPALEITIGSADRANLSEVNRLDNKRSPQVVRIDLSFKEPIGSMHKLLIGDGSAIQAYGIYDLIAEKLRAVLQQVTRQHPGERHQDIYDIDRLLENLSFDLQEKKEILNILIQKSWERDINPTADMLGNEKIVERLSKNWNRLRDDVEELPSFQVSFSKVLSFYKGLPWSY